jgi:hypothetical protein
MPAKTEKKNESKTVKKNEKKVQKVVKEEENIQKKEQEQEQEVTVDDDDVVVVKKETKRAKKKVEKTGPKKNKSSYMFFCVDEREKIKQERSELNNKEIVVELGARWKTLKESDQDRLKYYEKLATEDKERYSREKDSNVESGGSKVEVKKTKKTKKQSDDTEDVKPDEQKKTKVNGYINFCKENRELVKKNNPKISPKDITKELSVLWKNLSDSEKEEYKNK